MAQVKVGDSVKVHYTGTLADGTQFDSSVGNAPLEFSVGGKQVIAGFEDAVLGMTIGDSKTVHIPSDEAYGPYVDDLVAIIPVDQFPAHISPKVGLQLEMRQPDNRVITVAITDMSDDSVTLDANHPLAGKDLTFEIELVEIG
jgi:FKBP-type peptidyl-prolyl cis-trans isomerase 2